MEHASILRYYVVHFLLIFSFLFLNAKPVLTLSFPSLHDQPQFHSNIGLLGDAKFINADSSVQLTNPMPSSSGLLIHDKPLKFLGSDSTHPASFYTDFTFSISPHDGEGISFIIAPTDFPRKLSGKGSFGLSGVDRFLGIEFDTKIDENVGDENANHIGIDVSSLVSLKVSNVSSVNLVLNSGVKLHSWIDYDARSKILEIRLNKFGSTRPHGPLLMYQIDLSEMWKEEEVLVGLSSCTGNSVQTSSVYSWNFRVTNVPKWLHSQPVDPRIYSNEKLKHKKPVCLLGFLSGLIFVTGCGALAAFVALFLWTIFVSRQTEIPVECSMLPINFRYEKINVVAENGSEDAKK
ncbi:unnamed protein product [Ilex paraguariensis]|uniref:Legume lectin domain-containing protein n=1 Tax=Ilex paraguariensis TaxID=185542 RepID=A0ABC8RAV7_9AQUA